MKNRILEIINESNYSSVYSFEKITKNQEPLTEKTNAFLSPGNGGGGITGTYSNPYVLTYDESVIFANFHFLY